MPEKGVMLAKIIIELIVKLAALPHKNQVP